MIVTIQVGGAAQPNAASAAGRRYIARLLFTPADAMPTLLVSSKGQIMLPAALRRRLGMGAGARLKIHEEPDGVTLRVQRAVPAADMAALAGMVKAPSRGTPCRLQDFDQARWSPRLDAGWPARPVSPPVSP